MALPQMRSCLMRVESYAEGSPGRDAHNRPIKEWSTVKDIWVQLDPATSRGTNTIAADVTRIDALRTIRGDYWDLDGVTAGMRLIYDPEGTFETASRLTYFLVQVAYPDHASRGETVLQVRQTDAAGTTV